MLRVHCVNLGNYAIYQQEHRLPFSLGPFLRQAAVMKNIDNARGQLKIV